MTSTAIKGAPHLGVHLRLAGMALLWGASWPAGKIIAQAMPALAASAWRFSFAVVLLLAWLYQARGGFPTLSRNQWLAMAAGGAVGVFGYAVFFMFGLQRVPASRAALIVTVNPVFTTLFAVWLFKEHFNWKIGVGMACAVLGAATVLTHGAPWKILTGEIGLGEWLLIGCVLCWTGYSLIGKAAMKNIDSLASTAYTAVFGMILLWIAAFTFEGPQVLNALSVLDAHGIFSMAFIVIGSTVLAYAWYYEGIAKLGAGTAASYISLVPVFGVAISTVVLSEPLDASLLIGGALAIAGVVWMNRARS
ncbi:MAG: DMT family transporter [Burkholderiaceae bacterium]